MTDATGSCLPRSKRFRCNCWKKGRVPIFHVDFFFRENVSERIRIVEVLR